VDQALVDHAATLDAYAEALKWMAGILTGSGAVIAVLFYKLLQAKDAVAEAYKEVAPIASASLDSAKALERMVDNCPRPALHDQLELMIERVEDVAKRLEEAERDR